MKQIIDNALAAVQRKKNIVDNVSENKIHYNELVVENVCLLRSTEPISSSSPYYSIVEVEVKSRNYVFGINGEPDREYHNEARFNAELFERDLADSNRTISSCLEQINKEIQGLEKELAALLSKNAEESRKVEQLTSSITYYKEQLGLLQSSIHDLDVKLAPLRAKDSELTSNIKTTTSEIASLSHIKEMTSNLDSEVDYVVRTYTPQKRAFLLMQVWGKTDPDSLEIIEAIKTAGFDPHYTNNRGIGLLHLAGDKSDLVLLELCLKQDPNCVQDRTVLYHATTRSNDEFLQKILATKKDFTFGLQFIVEQNDAQALDKLFGFDPGLIKYADLYTAINQAKLSAAKVLIKKGVDCDQAIKFALEKNDGLFLAKLFDFYPESFANSKIDKYLLLKHASGSGHEKLIFTLTEEIKTIKDSLLLAIKIENSHDDHHHSVATLGDEANAF